ncbi:hypothetical protein [Hansschlegelia beijingensis]|uniref:Uncharacterized protein n=1 Tax=Hansschlegelia beijingensis TaxID=1133344 RepID=A0A7W6D3J2_9HYPH|nr:hypothetical protein [Hansschlegelia beijingensis]MBB3972508.1 hypothetical protein [Hansschlegelia beijingensis]
MSNSPVAFPMDLSFAQLDWENSGVGLLSGRSKTTIPLTSHNDVWVIGGDSSHYIEDWDALPHAPSAVFYGAPNLYKNNKVLGAFASKFHKTLRMHVDDLLVLSNVSLSDLTANPLSQIYINSVSARLERLRDGWAGPDTVAPSQRVIDDVARACVAVYQAADVEPEVEVDQDGTVVLEWRRGQRAFCLTFLGNGRLVGTISPWTEDYAPWQVPVSDELAIISKLEDPAVESFVRR